MNNPKLETERKRFFFTLISEEQDADRLLEQDAYYDLIKIPGHYEERWDSVILYYDAYGDPVWGYEYYDVWVETSYEDYYTGIIFEKVEATAKDLAKVSAIAEVAELLRPPHDIMCQGRRMMLFSEVATENTSKCAAVR